MCLLALDTATPTASVALADGCDVLAQHDRVVTTHSEGLLVLVEETLGALSLGVADVDAIVCGLGPGSFTGLRIGLATAKGLCFAADKPLIGLCSLDAVAGATARVVGEQRDVAVVLDARRGEMFVRVYRGRTALGDAVMIRPESFGETVTGVLAAFDAQREAAPDAGVGRERAALLVAGDGAERYFAQIAAQIGERFGERFTVELAPEQCHAVAAGELALAARARHVAGAYDDVAASEPLYLRAPDIRPPSGGLAAQTPPASKAP